MSEATSVGDEREGAELRELFRDFGFFTSCIKSGESWSPECEAIRTNAQVSLTFLSRQLAALHAELATARSLQAGEREDAPTEEEIGSVSEAITEFRALRKAAYRAQDCKFYDEMVRDLVSLEAKLGTARPTPETPEPTP